MKKFSITTIACFISIVSLAQYVTYTPLPYVPPLPVEMPKFTMPEYRRPPVTFVYSESKPVIKTYTAYLIQVAKINGNDFSQRYINGNAGVITYSFENDPKTFMNVVIPGESTKSYGYMLAETRQDVPATSKMFGKTIIDFSWQYANSYDSNRGSASCTLIKEYQPGGTKFGLLIRDASGLEIEFYGTVVPQ